MFERSGDTDQHGWPGPGVGQCVHRAVMAQREVRGPLSPRLPGRESGARGTGTILSFLQHRAASSGSGGQDAGGGPLRVELTGYRGCEGDWRKKRPSRMPHIERSRSGEGYGLGSHCPKFRYRSARCCQGHKALDTPCALRPRAIKAVFASCGPFEKNGGAENKVREPKDSKKHVH